MILRQPAPGDFTVLRLDLRKELKQRFGPAMRNEEFSLSMKACAVFSRFLPAAWQAVCQLLLRDKR